MSLAVKSIVQNQKSFHSSSLSLPLRLFSWLPLLSSTKSTHFHPSSHSFIRYCYFSLPFNSLQIPFVKSSPSIHQSCTILLFHLLLLLLLLLSSLLSFSLPLFPLHRSPCCLSELLSASTRGKKISRVRNSMATKKAKEKRDEESHDIHIPTHTHTCT